MNILNIRFLFPILQHYVSSPTYIFTFFFTGKLYSIIHDGIQKFSKELNGVMTRHTTPAMDPLTLPWSLTEIQGGSLNASKLCDHIFNTMKSIHPVQDAADAAIVKSLSQYHNSLNVLQPPSYFKVCQVLHFSEEKKHTVDHAELAYSNHSRWLLNKHVCWQQVGGELGINNTFYQV